MHKPGKQPHNGPSFYIACIWLVYMIFPITFLLKRPMNEMIIGLPIVFFFAIIYVYSFSSPKGRFLSIMVQIVIVGFFVFRYDINFLGLAFYPSPLIGIMKDKRKISVSIALLLILFISIGWTNNLMANTDVLLQLLPAMLAILGMSFAMWMGSRSRELKAKLSLANEEIAHLSKNEERQRISRDLHDTLGHTLSLITLKSELAEKLIIKYPERAVQEVKDIQATSRAALKQVRELVSGMSAVTVRDEIPHAKQILAAAGIDLEVKGDVGEGLAPLVDNILGMCLREAVTNIVKHSKAKVCKVEWAEGMESYKLMVIDKGEGVDMELCDKDASKNGLKGMRERLKLVEGDLQFESSKGKGTSVTFTVPRVVKSIEAGEKAK